ncbi:MAG: DUF2218 domain-containing protein [Chloroflexota bacterium]
MNAKSTIVTQNAAKLMRWTIGHFKPKVPAQYDETNGSVEFQFGTCNMEATADELIVMIHAEDANSLTSMKNIVGRHIDKFGIKENIQVEWEDQS